MRVALVSPYSLSEPGGVQGQVFALSRAFVRMGHDCLVVGPVDGALPAGAVGPSVDVAAAGRSVRVPANGSVARLSLNPLGARRAMAEVRRFGPDVVHIHEPLAPGPTWSALMRPGPKVGTFHRAGAVAGAALLAPAARRFTSRLSVRTAVSEAAADSARPLVGNGFQIVGNGVELERFRAATPSKRVAGSTPTVLFVGRHEPRKGLSVLLDSFGRLDRNVAVQLWVAGTGPETEGLRHRFGGDPRVEWLGRIDDDILVSRMQAADVVCAPALHGESFGVVLVEAMAAGAVVVASDIPGYRAVVDVHGELVPPGDASALSSALSSVVAQVATGTGRAAPAAIDAASAHASRWSMESIAAQYLAVYEQAMG